MKRISWLLILLATALAGRPTDRATLALAAGGEFRTLVLSQAISDNLALLFDQFEKELVLCLEGEQRGADLHVTDFRMPHIYLSETGRVQAASCDQGPNSIGTWHNHPAPFLTLASASTEALARNCYLSRTDISDFRRRTRAMVSVVSCAPNVYAYWRRSDVSSVVGDVAILPPPRGQLVKTPIPNGETPSGLTKARAR